MLESGSSTLNKLFTLLSPHPRCRSLLQTHVVSCLRVAAAVSTRKRAPDWPGWSPQQAQLCNLQWPWSTLLLTVSHLWLLVGWKPPWWEPEQVAELAPLNFSITFSHLQPMFAIFCTLWTPLESCGRFPQGSAVDRRVASERPMEPSPCRLST